MEVADCFVVIKVQVAEPNQARRQSQIREVIILENQGGQIRQTIGKAASDQRIESNIEHAQFAEGAGKRERAQAIGIEVKRDQIGGRLQTVQAGYVPPMSIQTRQRQ